VPFALRYLFFWYLYLKLLIMTTEILDRITINPEICHGKPTIRGLRYPVQNILELMASGMSFDDILEDYEDLEMIDLQACLWFAARLANVKHISKLVA
jgi:uncharacterized protein (DUF433 family)